MPDVTRLAITPVDTTALNEWRSLLDLRVHSPSGEIIFWKDSCGDLYTEIGQLIWTTDDGIHIHPYTDLHEDDLEVLYGTAVEAASSKPSIRDGWCRYTKNGRRGWVCTISTSTVPAPTARIIRTAEDRRARNGRLIRAAEPQP